MSTSSDENSIALLYEALDYITDVLLAFSLFGCFATVLTFLTFPEMRTYPIKLIVFLCISLFFAQLFFWLSFSAYDSIMCIPCAMILHYFFLASFFWTFCVAFNFYEMIVRRNRDAESLERIYHLVCWGAPLLASVIILGCQQYGDRGGYCYILDSLPIFLAFFLPGLIIVSANAVIFFFIAREIHDTLKSAPKPDKKEKSKEIRVYFSIFVSIGLSWIFGFIMNLLPIGSTLWDIFLVLYSLFTPIQGFLIFLSYCLNAKVASKWAGFIGRYLPYFKRYENLGQSTATSTTSGTSTSSGRIRSTDSDRSSRGSGRASGRSTSASASEDVSMDAGSRMSTSSEV